MEEKEFCRILVKRYLAKQLSDDELEVFVELTKQGRLDEELTLVMNKAAGITEADEWGAMGKPRVTRMWVRIVVAAAAVAAVMFGIWVFVGGKYGIKNGDQLYASDIVPGKNTATLTLANGKVIALDTNRASVVVADSMKYLDPSEAGMNIVASTPKGGTYQVVLPDGTRVWLNADSKISFPSKFDGKERRILLYGEAYLEVTKNTIQPFIVESKGQEVTVLGTHFNINSYGDEGSTRTTLLEGSVEVNGTLLKPDQQAILTANRTIVVKSVDVREVIAWKDGYFRFTKTDLKTLMRQISRWYDVEVVYEGDVKNELFNGVISRQSNLSDMLEILKSGDVDFDIEQVGGKKRLIIKD